MRIAPCVAILAAGTALGPPQDPDMTERAKAFVAAHEQRVRPLEIKSQLAWWNANTSGKDEDFATKEKAQNDLDKALGDKARFAEAETIHKGKVTDKRLAR